MPGPTDETSSTLLVAQEERVCNRCTLHNFKELPKFFTGTQEHSIPIPKDRTLNKNTRMCW